MAEWTELQKMQGCRLPELMDSLDFTIYLALAEFSVSEAAAANIRSVTAPLAPSSLNLYRQLRFRGLSTAASILANPASSFRW